jgi:uracil-DNA glycosylase
MEILLESSWKKSLKDELKEPYFLDLTDKVQKLYRAGEIFPAPENIFHSLSLCPIEDVHAVILGQDPYHGPGQAHGLAFSVPDNTKIPPSLKNIYREIQSDLGKSIPISGNLERWAKQGVLLLNTTLTVERGNPNSHQRLGWEKFTDAIIKKISSEKEHVVFLLWGNFARAKKTLIDTDRHLVLEAPHPSPFSAYTGFFDSKHFSKTNEYLAKHGLKSIDW